MSVWLYTRKIDPRGSIFHEAVAGEMLHTEKKKRLSHIFVDFEVIKWALSRQRVPERLIEQVMAL